MVGAQDLGDFIELRRMYVRLEFRRLGIGSLLVQALIDHCRGQRVETIKLWTAEGGPGRFFYQALGFRQVALQGDELTSKPGMGSEIRMRLDSTDQPGVLEVE